MGPSLFVWVWVIIHEGCVGGRRNTLRPLSILALLATATLSFAILYNAFLGQMVAARAATLCRLRGNRWGGLDARRCDRLRQQRGTIVLKYDPRVEEVQRALLATGNYKGMVDGVAGQNTRLAIANYQKSAGLRVNGEISPELIEHLRYTQQVAAASQFTASVAALDKTPEDAAALRQVQTGLAELGYAPGEITGDLTSATIQAIIQFEKDRGLPRHGTVSDALLDEISKMSGDSVIAPRIARGTAMRLKSEVWVQAFMRRCNVEGKYCTIAARGRPKRAPSLSSSTGLMEAFHLFGPAPGPAFDEHGDRRFIEELPFPASEADVVALLARRKKFDSDLWIVEVEDRHGTAGITPAKI